MACVKEFPELVKLHQRRAKDGVVCMSVSVDDEIDRYSALGLLKRKKATFPNFLIGQPAWCRKWDIVTIPVVLVFDREGRLARKFENQFTYEDVDKVVEKLLQPAK